MPQKNYQGCQRRDLHHDTGSAQQSRMLSIWQYRDVRIFNVRVTQFWTPNSGRNFLPTATADLGYSSEDRASQARDRYSGVAKQRMANMQKWVARTFSERQ